MSFQRLSKFLAVALGAPMFANIAPAQLAITEVMASASTNLGSTFVPQSSDFWELTNFGTNAINLSGYKWNDNAGGAPAGDTVPFQDLSIGPGESILFMETNFPVMSTPDQFRAWWNLPATQKVVVYIGNGLSSSGDGVRVWDGADQLVDTVDFGAAERGRSFTYDPSTGIFGVNSTNGVAGAFQAATADDAGSPGTTAGPVPVQILTQPASQKVNPGDTVTFRVSAGSLPRPRFQWFFNGQPVVGAVATTLTVTDVQNDKLGDYGVSVENGVVSLLSSNATLTLNPRPEPPVFVTSPQDKNAFAGQFVIFTSLASGTPQPTYQWYLDDLLLGGSTGPSYTIQAAASSDAGMYRVVATNPLGSATNQAALLVTRRPRLVITEIMAAQSTNPPAAGHGDWWELTNLDDFSVDLSGYRFDDGSALLSTAVTLTNKPLTIAPGESIVFVENMSPDAFRSWWGSANLVPGLQIISYRGAGLGLATLGDAINLWNSAATDDADTIASEVFSTATLGVSFGYNPDTELFGELTQAGFHGAFAARESGDIGSPGLIRNPVNPRVLSFGRGTFGWILTWTAIAGRNYTVQSTSNPGGETWTTLGTVPAAGEFQSFTDTTEGDRQFYRVVLDP
jgi:hypothetical protein